MAAPGKNLEFNESPFYTSKVAPCPELANEISRHLENRPGCGTAIGGGIRSLEFQSRGQGYTVIFARLGQKVCLMNIFKANATRELGVYLDRLHETFKMPKKSKP